MSDIVKIALEEFRKDKQHWQEIYAQALDDLKFLSDAEDAQWDWKDYNERRSTGRPAVTVDQLSQFVHQVANDIRMNTPSINVIPGGNGADEKVAEAYKGIIRNIEYVARADDARDTATLNSVKSSLGFTRIDHDFVDADSFDQHILIKRVNNPLGVFIDRASIECDGSDMRHATILDKMPVTEFKKTYKGKAIKGFDDDKGNDSLKDDDFVTIAEFFMKEEIPVMLGMLEDGTVEEMVDGKAYAKTRQSYKCQIKRYKLSGADVLEETTFPGKYVPIVPYYGEEAWEDGKRKLFSLIRKAKDSQRLYNVMKSNEIEVLLKQPQSPYMAPEGSVEAYREDWLEPSKTMVLRYKTRDDKGQPLPPPERMQPPTIPTGFMQAGRNAIDDIKATMGLYNASIGARSNETSGVAIAQRKQEGDVATFHFADNANRAIAQEGRIIVSMIPEIYDTARVLRVIDDEENPKQIGVNGEMVEDQEDMIDLKRGKYDVRVVTGAPFTTRRQEAFEFYTQIVTKQPELMKVMGDLLFKYADFTGSEAMASRMKKVIDPQFLDEQDKEQMGVDPEKQQMQQLIEAGMQEMQAMQMELQQTKDQLGNKQAETAIKLKDSQVKAEIEVQKLALEAQKLGLEKMKVAIDAKKVEADSYKAELDAQIRMMEAQSGPAQMPQTPEFKLDTTGFQFVKTPEQLALEEQELLMKQQKELEEAEKERMEMETERQELEFKAQQTQMIIQSLESIRRSLDELNRPKQVVYGEDGRLQGVK